LSAAAAAAVADDQRVHRESAERGADRDVRPDGRAQMLRPRRGGRRQPLPQLERVRRRALDAGIRRERRRRHAARLVGRLQVSTRVPPRMAWDGRDKSLERAGAGLQNRPGAICREPKGPWPRRCSSRQIDSFHTDGFERDALGARRNRTDLLLSYVEESRYEGGKITGCMRESVVV